MILLGIGSNLNSSYGDRFKNINLAISYLESLKIKILKKSSFYKSPSYPNVKDPEFINIVIAISTLFTPSELASKLIFIEEKLERKRNYKNEPRTCDIDIIDYNGKIIDFNFNNLNFVVPHERLSNRSFVLIPIKEILPDWKHPATNEHIDLLINRLSSVDKKSILKVLKS